MAERPRLDGRLETCVAKKVHHGRMFHKNRLEGRDVTRNVVFDHAKVPLAEETLQGFCKVRTHCPRSPKGGSAWGGLSFPPVKGQGPVWLLDVGRKTAQGIA